ncbi:RICIN domain-containing protein [Actinoallomurus purpureus]|uniref:RICIN domain-containing protein n=1 Tax=Actinoallomurus purpureus TaxID=478114 RepID=UPI0020931E20|nr:RICIN domain-containing protein [Actinoallomurus purpureus]MCO6008191.1 RICIN domain-containing protein [Actinoallomurus purpureus]
MNGKQVAIAMVSSGAMLVGGAFAASASAVSPAPAFASPSVGHGSGSDVHTQIMAYQYKSVASGLCLDTKTKAGNQAIRRESCHKGNHKDIKHQRWILGNDKSFHSLISPGNCLALRQSVYAISKKCSSKDKTQRWKWTGGKTPTLVNLGTNKCLALNHPPYLLVVKCNPKNKAQQWKRFS